MKAFASYRLHITPLSPIHIGTGESFQPTNYVIEGGILHEFDSGAVTEALSAGERKELLRIASAKPNEEMIKAMQGFFYNRREALLPWAVHRVPVLPQVASLYASRVGQTANQESSGGQVLNRLEIDRTAFNPISRQPVLFGSSLKGAIRTALLDKVNGGNRALPDERKGLHEFQGRLLSYRDPGSRRLKLERDPLRLVQLSDSAWRESSGLTATSVHLAVNRKKTPVKDEKGQLRRAMGENLYQILECVSPWRYRTFSGQLNLQRLDGLPRQEQMPAREFRYTVEALATACNRFYLPVLAGETKALKERGFADHKWCEALQKTLKQSQDRLKAGQTFVLRVGRHSGAESMTVSGTRKIKILKGKGQPADDADAAKTLWLAAETKDQQTGLLPFGWLLMEIEPLDAPETDWPELKALCEERLGGARELAERLQAQTVQAEKTRAAVAAKHREEQERTRLAAEQQARAEQERAEREQRLQTMGPELRAIEEFRVYYADQRQKGRYQPGSQFDEKRRALLQAALGWTEPATRREAAALLRETIKNWTDWPSKKERKAEFRSGLEALES
ncbi:RAMP superfamily CRISPR-associated protein [Methylococcus mesophilus]|uniref:RAMP superfamily CRISPR-associated protein n=1 Tax=Methylococcus mesophilus TaxID=2993564 RepID=UPI00224B1B72|nr:RAMP superfamily CRISPR-associated protein [Methylococcus mesophilus]UZR29627.1 RAMP superfamily CRISPR-associated protein [Methylococcus mesophilus]